MRSSSCPSDLCWSELRSGIVAPSQLHLADSAAMLALVLLESGLSDGSHKLALHFSHEWIALTNLILLLLGFAVLANQFEHSNVPDVAPGLLPNGWAGGFAPLSIVAGLSDTFWTTLPGNPRRSYSATHVSRSRKRRLCRGHGCRR